MLRKVQDLRTGCLPGKTPKTAAKLPGGFCLLSVGLSSAFRRALKTTHRIALIADQTLTAAPDITGF